MTIKLSTDEYNVLNKIASQTKMDCWFYLAVDHNGGDCVHDLEVDAIITLRQGIEALNEGIVPELLDLTNDEITTYIDVIYELGIDFNPFEE
jgi:hypothetical protein